MLMAAASAPVIGPALVTIFGVDVPPLALGTSLLGLLLARTIAPPPLRKLNKKQELALTILLCVILFLLVTGEIGNGKPLGGGMAAIWGIGLGFSGLMIVEFFGDKVVAMSKVILGVPHKGTTDDQDRPPAV